jgi:hypothetical protein
MGRESGSWFALAGVNASALPAISVASLVGFGAVVAALPAFVTLLSVCSCTHGSSYKDVLMVVILGAIITFVVVIVLGSLVGSLFLIFHPCYPHHTRPQCYPYRATVAQSGTCPGSRF